MHANVSHAQRGQAIVETVLFLPLFLLALFGIMWAVRAAVQYERTQSAVRYAGLIAQADSPYDDYSLYSMYSQLPLTSLPTQVCNMPQAVVDTLTDAAPTYTSTASPPFWSPLGTPSPLCPVPAIVGFPASTGFDQDVILTERNPSVTAQISVPAALTGVFGTTATSITASGYFFRTVGVNTLVACYPALETQIKKSLDFTLDTSAATPPSALNSNFALTLAPQASCATL
jgi:Flp pilus assembly protein TadG